jgi:23S rRNA pseudouridine1911/1915/1917 synthase
MVMGISGRYSLTNYRVLREFKNIASLVECKLDTGRTHQIRVHFSALRHPLVGDRLYNGSSRKIKGIKNSQGEFVESFSRQALHSKQLSFFHPATNEPMNFECNLPTDMRNLVDNLEIIATP